MRAIHAATLALLLPMLTLATPVLAVSRYTSTQMACADVQAKIAQEGAVILRYSGRKGIPLYDRYVASGRQCSFDEFAKASTVPTADRQNCPVRHCERRPEPEDCRNFLEPGCFGLD
ncbi:hypothetical protein SAMN05880590_10197 [Rhizobium sp. RU35A]|uniref:hypothetical protein n=1 Tax=Rhizobium sp. RU35A TaxID=1907414 RepID=UPI000955AFD1|nr:hypothetical protein [Rhizobium sp. RU35A]SIP90158.1 hypothetical protein SAMN05880590_10197 [Rhizobium sp. RU35A]